MSGMLEAFSYFFFFFQTFAYPNDYLNNKRDFLRKIAPEIVLCHVEAVRQGQERMSFDKVQWLSHRPK